jgi:hypothetical protein
LVGGKLGGYEAGEIGEGLGRMEDEGDRARGGGKGES